MLYLTLTGLPQAKLTVFPASVTDGEMRLVCEGFDNRTVSECFFYSSGQENFTTPSVSCELSLTGSKLIIWSGDDESSYVNTVCYYVVSELGKFITSAHSDEVSVRVRGKTPFLSSWNRSTKKKQQEFLYIFGINKCTEYFIKAVYIEFV